MLFLSEPWFKGEVVWVSGQLKDAREKLQNSRRTALMVQKSQTTYKTLQIDVIFTKKQLVQDINFR